MSQGMGCLIARLIVTSLLFLAPALLGCNEQSNRLPARGRTGSPSTATGPAALPQGPFPRGQVAAALLPDPATVGPVISILTPARGAQETAGQVTVTARVEDVDGVAAVMIAGTPVSASGSDYSAQVALTPGVNLIRVEAIDALGNGSSAYVSVTHGAFAPHDRVQARTVAAGLTQAGLDRVGDLAGELTKDVDLFALIAHKNPILKNFALEVRATALRHGPPRFAATGLAAGVEVTLTLDALALDADIDVIGVALTQATIQAQSVVAVVQATVSQTAFSGTKPGKRALGLEIESIDVTLHGFQLVTSSPFFTSVLNPFQPLLHNMIRDQLEDMLIDVVNLELGKSLAGLDTPLRIAIPNPVDAGATLDLDLLFEVDEAHGYAGAGLGLIAGFQVTPAQIGVSGSTDVLTTGAQVTPAIGPEPFTVRISQDGLNALLGSLYLTGGAGALVDGTKLPVGGLSANLLYPFLPPVRSLAPDPTTPVVLEASVCAAPVVTIEGTPGAAPVKLAVGELEVSLAIDYMDGDPAATLFVLRAGLEIEADVTIHGNTLSFSTLTCTGVDAEILSEPTCDLEDQQIVDFLRALCPRLMVELQQKLPAMPLPALPFGMDLQNVRLEAAPAVLTVRGSL